MTENESMNEEMRDEAALSDRPSDPLGGLLKSAMADPPLPEKSLLPGIQQRIRIRTKGRYYRDRWSTAKDPVSLLLMTALLLLILAAAMFLVMQPLWEAAQETTLPAPAVDPLSSAPSAEPTDPPLDRPSEPGDAAQNKAK